MSGKGGRESICDTRCKIETRASADTGLPYSLCDPSPTIRPTCECYSERMSPSHLYCCALHQPFTVPIRMNSTVTKTRLKGAQTGHSLLKKKGGCAHKSAFFARPAVEVVMLIILSKQKPSSDSSSSTCVTFSIMCPPSSVSTPYRRSDIRFFATG